MRPGVPAPDDPVSGSPDRVPGTVGSHHADAVGDDVVRDARVGRRPVGEVMSRPVLAVTADRRLVGALEAMAATGLRHLVAVDPAGHYVGVLSDRAVAAIWAANPADLIGLRVRDVLESLPTVRAAVSVAEVAALMATLRVDAAVVVGEAGRPRGIVTAMDLVGVLAEEAPPPTRE